MLVVHRRGRRSRARPAIAVGPRRCRRPGRRPARLGAAGLLGRDVRWASAAPVRVERVAISIFGGLRHRRRRSCARSSCRGRPRISAARCGCSRGCGRRRPRRPVPRRGRRRRHGRGAATARPHQSIRGDPRRRTPSCARPHLARLVVSAREGTALTGWHVAGGACTRRVQAESARTSADGEHHRRRHRERLAARASPACRRPSRPASPA